MQRNTIISIRRFALALTAFALSIALRAEDTPPQAAQPITSAGEPLVVQVTLNDEAKGEIIVFSAADGDYLVKRSDLVTLGVGTPEGQAQEIDGEVFYRLRSLSGVQYSFDEKTLTLALQVAPAQLAKIAIDLASRPPKDLLTPRDTSAFWNYRAAYQDAAEGSGWLLNSELGARRGDYGFFTDSFHRFVGPDRGDVRLTTALTHDWRERLTRFTLGDFIGVSGELGAPLALGGISFAKFWALDPYVVREPTYGFSGALSNAAEAQVLLDGVPLTTQPLPAGEFEIRNLNYYGGARDVVVVVKDKFGRVREFVNPFYFTDELLRRGLHDYAYNLGALRENFGSRSNDYGSLVFSGFHRYGVRDDLVLGLRWETSLRRSNVGPQATFGLGRYGVASFGFGVGKYDGVAAAQHQVNAGYSYQRSLLNANLLARSFSRDYRFIGQRDDTEQPRSELFAALGWGNAQLGTVTLALSNTERQQAADQRVASIGYSRSLWRSVNLFATLSRVRGEQNGTEIFAGLSYNPSSDYNVTALHQRRVASGTSNQIVAGKNVPFGEGVGYRVALEHTRNNGQDASSVNPFVQYNARYATLSAEYLARRFDGRDDDHRYELALAGGVGYVGGSIGVSRPIEEGFGLVRLPGLADVRVYQNNQEVGRTNAKGELFLPNLGAYIANQVSVSDKDVPINYSIDQVERYVAPGQRGGAVIEFAMQRIQAVAGKLLSADTQQPMEHIEAALEVAGRRLTLPTGKGGEFYLENLAPGRYRGSARPAGKACTFALQVPVSEEVVIELGEVTCAP